MPRNKGTTPEQIAAYKAAKRKENQRWYAAHKEEVDARNRANYHADPEKHNERTATRRNPCRKQRLRLKEAYPELCPPGKERRSPRPPKMTEEQRKERDRERYARDRERRLEMARAYRKENPEKVVSVTARWRARRAAAPGENYTASQFRALKAYYGHSCAYCAQRGQLVVEHIVPISKGGSNAIENIAPACATCNGRKGAGSLGSFLRRERRSGRTPNIVTYAQFWERRIEHPL